MPRYQIITLVDITRTNPSRSETDHVKLSQQANFNSLIQAIGMRSNVTWDRDPTTETSRVPNQDFKAAYWNWEFFVEREQVFLKDHDPVGLLKSDLDGVPIVAGLGDSVELAPACFFSQGDRINTWIREIS
jgi:hypothetical protein